MRCAESILKAGLYGLDLSFVIHNILDKLCDRCYETILSHCPINDCVHERGWIVKVAQPRLQIFILISTMDHSRYWDIDKSVDGRLLPRSHGVCVQIYGFHKCFFDGSPDWVMKAIRGLALCHGVDEIAKVGLVDYHGIDRIIRPRLIQGVDGFTMRFWFLKYRVPSVYGFSIVHRRLHCLVPCQLRGPPRMVLRFVCMRDDVEAVGKGSQSTLRYSQGWNDVVTNMSWWCSGRSRSRDHCKTMFTWKNMALNHWLANQETQGDEFIWFFKQQGDFGTGSFAKAGSKVWMETLCWRW